MAVDGVNVTVPNSDDDMQVDIDAHAQHQQQPPMLDPQLMLQQMMQLFMQQMSNTFAQHAGQVPGVNSATAGPQTGASVPKQQDMSMGNVRLDVKAFSRIEKFTDKTGVGRVSGTDDRSNSRVRQDFRRRPGEHVREDGTSDNRSRLEPGPTATLGDPQFPTH